MIKLIWGVLGPIFYAALLGYLGFVMGEVYTKERWFINLSSVSDGKHLEFISDGKHYDCNIKEIK